MPGAGSGRDDRAGPWHCGSHLAGPDVFRPSIGELAAAQHRLCAELGVVALHPADHPGLTPPPSTATTSPCCGRPTASPPTSTLSRRRNRQRHRFRGRLCRRPRQAGGRLRFPTRCPGRPGARPLGPLVRDEARRTWHDRDGDLVENFGYPVNLMIGVPCAVVTGGLRQAIETLKRAFWNAPGPAVGRRPAGRSAAPR